MLADRDGTGIASLDGGTIACNVADQKIVKYSFFAKLHGHGVVIVWVNVERDFVEMPEVVKLFDVVPLKIILMITLRTTHIDNCPRPFRRIPV
ncbi:hypothetical protein DF057_21640 [Burkholderia cepacia]|nr:hypothetical protein DF057_21640 [Burkholderia cepacia]